MPFTLVSATFVYLSFSDRNLAVEGKAFLKETYRWERKKIPAIIDGNHTRAYWDNACPYVYEMETTWFRVEFLRLVEVFAVKIKPGKLNDIVAGRVRAQLFQPAQFLSKFAHCLCLLVGGLHDHSLCV